METIEKERAPLANPAPVDTQRAAQDSKKTATTNAPTEIGGNGKAEPTRYGDWEIAGKCVDF